jgi:hypothetical protein
MVAVEAVSPRNKMTFENVSPFTRITMHNMEETNSDFASTVK